MKKMTLTVALLAATALFSPAFANDDAAEFVKKASTSNLFEIESSKIAQERAQNAEVRALAEKLIADHTKAGNDLKAALKGTNIAPVTALDEKHQQKIKDLREVAAADFDKKYLDIQEDAHDDAIDLFEDYAKDGEHAELKAFAANTLPVLKTHDEHVEKLDK